MTLKEQSPPPLVAPSLDVLGELVIFSVLLATNLRSLPLYDAGAEAVLFRCRLPDCITRRLPGRFYQGVG